MAGRRPDALDEALGVLHGHAPEFGPIAFSNHGPMAAEALVAMDRPGAVGGFVARYAPQLDPIAPPVSPVPDTELQASLGDRHRWPAWLAYYRSQLAERGHGALLHDWVPTLTPGASSAAAHGMLRVAHAARALDREVTVPRMEELAHGLAYWASTFSPLPGAAGQGPTRFASEAIAAVPRLPPSDRGGSISGQLAALARRSEFADVFAMASVDDEYSPFLTDLTRMMVGLYEANAAAGTVHDFAFIHGVTGASAVRLLLPHLRPADARQLTLRAWQLGAGIYSVYSDVEPAEVAAGGAPPEKAALIDRAVACGDEHAIKYTEACLREVAAGAPPSILHSAVLATERLGG